MSFKVSLFVHLKKNKKKTVGEELSLRITTSTTECTFKGIHLNYLCAVSSFATLKYSLLLVPFILFRFVGCKEVDHG